MQDKGRKSENCKNGTNRKQNVRWKTNPTMSVIIINVHELIMLLKNLYIVYKKHN